VTTDWDASTYQRVSGPQAEWSQKVLARLPLEGDETVLDAGCGSGRVTRFLLDRLPHGHVVAVDAAPSMVEYARELLGDRATVLCQDLAHLRLDEPVDAAFSNAVFHWVLDHQALFDSLFAALKPGAPLVAQCGGRGNIDRFHEIARDVARERPYAEYFEGWTGPWNFAGPEETAERLERAGFTDIETWLEPAPTRPEDPESFSRTVCLRPHIDRLPEALRDDYVREVVARHDEPFQLDYVRLNIDARRPG
jgi:trans-aconitate 2-methyltransferase